MASLTDGRSSILTRLEQAGLHPFCGTAVPQEASVTPRRRITPAAGMTSSDRSIALVKQISNRKVG